MALIAPRDESSWPWSQWPPTGYPANTETPENEGHLEKLKVPMGAGMPRPLSSTQVLESWEQGEMFSLCDSQNSKDGIFQGPPEAIGIRTGIGFSL